MLIRCLCLVISVHENVLFRRMTMEIAEKEYVSTLKGLLHHEFGMIEDRILLTAGTNPLTIEILAYKRAPIVSYNHAIRIQHRNYLKNESVSEGVSLVLITN